MTTKPKPPPSAARSLWWLLPIPLRQQLRARCPLDARVSGDSCLIVHVGSGTPLRWLMLVADDHGRIRCRLWEVLRDGERQLDQATTTADAVPALLQRWAKEYLKD